MKALADRVLYFQVFAPRLQRRRRAHIHGSGHVHPPCAWVFGFPGSSGPSNPQKANFRRNLDFRAKTLLFAK
jgi:hypothetical protein